MGHTWDVCRGTIIKQVQLKHFLNVPRLHEGHRASEGTGCDGHAQVGKHVVRVFGDSAVCIGEMCMKLM